MNLSKLFLFVLVFVVETDVESVSVLMGDSVTLRTGLTKRQIIEQIQWKFGDQDIADLTIFRPETSQSKTYKEISMDIITWRSKPEQYSCTGNTKLL